MQCLKCGNEIGEKESFCQACLESMEAYPVKPGTPVTIPKRSPHVKREPRKQIKPEEIIADLQASIRRLKCWIAVLIVLLLASLGAAGYLFFTREDAPSPGQNYSTFTDPPEESTPGATLP